MGPAGPWGGRKTKWENPRLKHPVWGRALTGSGSDVTPTITKLCAQSHEVPFSPFCPAPMGWGLSYRLTAASHPFCWCHTCLSAGFPCLQHPALEVPLSAQPNTSQGPLSPHWWADFDYSDQMSVFFWVEGVVIIWFKFKNRQWGVRMEQLFCLHQHTTVLCTIRCF